MAPRGTHLYPRRIATRALTHAWTPADTPTGLALEDLRALSEDEAVALAGWHAAKAGDNDGSAWWPWAIRAMPLDTRLHLASDQLADAVWETQERSYVIADPHYLVNGYGHVQPPEGEPIPFRMWDEQEDVLDAFIDEAITVILKARQLGLTWIALHYAVWLLAFAQHTPRARILLLSKTLDDAKKLLRRVRRILMMLPPFLRPVEGQRTGAPGESVTELVLQTRGSVQSLPASPKAARMETVTFALVDEAAFQQAFQDTWQALLSALGATGQAAVVSTGNGPAEAPGEGQAYARLWTRARSGEDEQTAEGRTRAMRGIFLPDSTHPGRSDEWRAEQQDKFITDEDFYAEHPETEEQALMGRVEGKAYSPGGINAAEKLGRRFDAMLDNGTIPPPADGGWMRIGSDYGEHTHHLLAWPLEGGGVYICGEVVGGGTHGKPVREMTLDLCRAVDGVQWIEPAHGTSDEYRWPLVHSAMYDAAGPESNRTLRDVVHANLELYPVEKFPDRNAVEARTRTLDVFDTRQSAGGRRIRTVGVPFGGPAGRKRSMKVALVDYTRGLLKRSAAAVTGDGPMVGVLAISPRCVVLLRQLRGLETMDDGTGRIKKGDDHGPDALLTVQLPSAAKYHGVVLPDEDKAAA